MNSGFSGQAQDERQRAWEAAREAARRAGMSVNEWLDTTLIDLEMRNPSDRPSSPHPPNSGYSERPRRAAQEDLSESKAGSIHSAVDWKTSRAPMPPRHRTRPCLLRPPHPFGSRNCQCGDRGRLPATPAA